MRTVCTAFLGVLLFGCGSSEQDVTLATQTFMQEFNTGQMGTLPMVSLLK